MMNVSDKIKVREPFYIIDIHLIVKKLLILYILLLPFQDLLVFFVSDNVYGGDILKRAISYSDEVTTVILLAVLLTFIALKPHSFNIIDVGITKPLLFFIAAGFFSILWNGVYVVQGAFGVYNFIKNIIVVYLFASLKWNKEDLLDFIGCIKVVVIFLAVAGIVGEGLALYGIDPWGLVVFEETTKRLGLYRVVSFAGFGNQNYLGMYAVLCLFLIYTTTENVSKRRLQMTIVLVLIFLTLSRQAWMGLVIMMILLNRRWVLPAILLFPLIGLVIILFQSSFFNYRVFAYIEALRLFATQPLFGVGPGMFGSVASVIFDSPYYEDWPDAFKRFIYTNKSIDAFWPVVLAETGLVGLISYIFVWRGLYRKIRSVSYKIKENIMLFRLGAVLRAYIVALVFMCFTTGFNKPFVVYTFFALCGMYISISYRLNNKQAT